jgi:hypothetical protein
MKHLYFFRKPLALTIGLLAVINCTAQNETTTADGNCGVVTENFNNGTGGFTSKSLYTPDLVSDSEFYYNATRGFWTEMGSAGHERTVAQGNPAPGAQRTVSILSATYVNPNPAGIFDVGFYYIVPNPQVDLFHVTLIRITQDGGGNTVSEVVAESGLKTFSQFSTPSSYTDPSNAQQNGFQGAVCIRLADNDITASASTYYRVSVVYRIFGGTNFTAFDDFSIGAIEQVSLPVSFLGIAAKRENNNVNLRWSVGDEKDLKEYQVERSITGYDFMKVGTVAVKGATVYTFSDVNINGAAYYRIKSVDLDGKGKYSSIVKIGADRNSSFSNILKLYPVPVLNELTVEHGQLGAAAKIIITGIDGKVIRTVYPANGSSHTPISFSGNLPGMYVLRLYDGKGKVESIKFIKQ